MAGQTSNSGSSFNLAQGGSGNVPPPSPNAPGAGIKPVLTLAKPPAGSQPSFDANAFSTIDLRSIANDQIVLLRDGRSLKIIFADDAVVTIVDFFYEGIEQPQIQVADQTVLTPQQFAQSFPVTTDPSVLPASGPAGGPAGGNGADVAPNADLAALSAGRNGPLDLLGDTNFTLGQPEFDIQSDDAPRGGDTAGSIDEASTDESALDRTNQPITISGNLNINFGRDGFGSVRFDGRVELDTFGGPSADLSSNARIVSGLTSGGSPISFVMAPGGLTISGFATIDGAEKEIFRATLGGSSPTYSFTLFEEIDNLGARDLAQVLVFSIDARDRDGDASLAPSRLSISIADDVPEIVSVQDGPAQVFEGDTRPGNFSGENLQIDTDKSDETDNSTAGGQGPDGTPLPPSGESDKLPDDITVAGSLGIEWGADDDTGYDDAPGDLIARKLAFLPANGDGGELPEDETPPDDETPPSDDEVVLLRVASPDSLTNVVRAVLVSQDGSTQQTLDGLYSGGELVKVWIDPNPLAGVGGELLARLIGYTGELGDNGEPINAVFVVTLDAGTFSGSYNFTLLGQIDHLGEGLSDGDLENLILTFGVRATDADGDDVDAQFSIAIRDDKPEASGETLTKTLNENDIDTGLSLGTSPSDGSGDGSLTGATPADVGGPARIEGTLAGLVKGGADENGTFSLETTNLSPSLQNLTSKGEPITYSIVGGVFTASAGERTVFTFELGANGAYKVLMFDQIDHVQTFQSITSTGSVAVNVADVADAGGRVVVEPRSTSANQLTFLGRIDGDAIFRVNNGSDAEVTWTLNAPGGGTDYVLRIPANSAMIINVGAVADGLGYSVLTNPGSFGTATTGSAAIAVSGGPDAITLDLSSAVTFTDFDGDSVALSGSFLVTVQDDAPEASGKIVVGTLNENDIDTGLSLGTSPSDGSGDGSLTGATPADVGGPARIEGTLAGLVKGGADENGTFSLETTNLSPSLQSLTSKGEPITYSIVGGVFTASAGERTVFTFELGANGAFKVLMFDQIDHGKSVLGLTSAPVPLSEIGNRGDTFEVASTGGTSRTFMGRLDDGDVIIRVTNGTGEIVNWTLNNTGSGPDYPLTIPAGTAVFVNVGQLTSTTVFNLQGTGAPSGTTSVGAGDAKPLTIVDNGASLSLDLSSAVTFTDFDGDSVALTGSFLVNVVDDQPVAEFSGTGIVNESDLESAAPSFAQAFDSGDTADFTTGTSYGALAIKASGDDGIVTRSGAGSYALATQSAAGPFTRFGGYDSTFDNGFTTSIDIYLDPARFTAGEGFDYAVAASKQDGSHLRDFIFHVTKDTSTGQLLVGGSNNTNFAPREDLENVGGREVTAAGWYTFKHTFFDAGDGTLSVKLAVLDASGTEIFSTIRNNPADTIADIVGGNRYGWFTNIDVAGGIAIDNVLLTQGTGAPEPTSTTGQLQFALGADEDASVTSVTMRESFPDGQRALDPDSNTGSFTTDFPKLTANGVPISVSTTSLNGVITLTGTAGSAAIFTLVVQPDGAYSFTLSGPVDHPDINEGGASDALRLVFDFTVTDADGDTSTNAFQIDIRDDVPSAGPVSSTIDENGSLSVDFSPFIAYGADGEGSLSFTLADLNVVSQVTLDLSQIDIQRSGLLFTLTPNGAFDALAAGQSATITLPYNVTDGDNDVATALITLTVTGSNDGPFFVSGGTVTGSVAEDSNVSFFGLLRDSGSIRFDDLDLADTHSVSVELDSVAGVPHLPPIYQALFDLAAGEALRARINDSATGAGDGRIDWSFNLPNGLVQFLGEGVEATLTYVLTLRDSSGATTQQAVTVTVTGDNDAPRIVLAQLTGSVTETPGTPADDAAPLITNGTIVFRDLDIGDDYTITVLPVGAAPLGGVSAALSTTIEAVGATNGVVTWTYSVDPKTIESLAAGETRIERFAITINDGTASTTRTVSVTLTGTNDAPVIEVSNANASYTDIDGTNLDVKVFASSGIAVSDVDGSGYQSVTVAVENPEAGDRLHIFAADRNGIVLGHGTQVSDAGSSITITATSGLLTAERIAEALADIQFRAGEAQPASQTRNIKVTVVDAAGGVSASASLTLDVIGTNDTPTWKAANLALAFTTAEDTAVLLHQVGIDDLELTPEDRDDEGPSLLTLSVSHGTLHIDEAKAAALNVTIVSGNGTRQVVVSGAMESALDDLLITPDNIGSSVTYRPDADYHGIDQLVLTINDQGDQGLGAKQATRIIDINVTAVDDVQVITGTISGNVGELGGISNAQSTQNGYFNQTTGDLNASGADVWVAENYGAPSDKGWGQYGINAAGEWQYVLLSNDPAVEALKEGQVETDTFTVRTVDGTQQQVTVTIYGNNDAPVVVNPIADQNVDKGQQFTFKLPGNTFKDVDGLFDGPGELIIEAFQANGNPLPNWLAFDASTGTFNGQPPANFTGSLNIRVYAFDKEWSVSDDFILTVKPANEAPRVNREAVTAFGRGYEVPGSTSEFTSFQVVALATLFVAGAGQTPAFAIEGAAPAGFAVQNGNLVFDANTPTGQHTITVSATLDGETVTRDLTVWVAGSTTGMTAASTNGDDTFVGSDAVNAFNGAQASDFIDGKGGNDTLGGGQQIDVIYGGGGADTINGGQQNDYLNGQDGDDVINGEEGSDLLIGGAGNDTLNGGNGDDILLGGLGQDRLTGENGADIFVFGAEALVDGLNGIVDTITDYDSNDLIDISSLLSTAFSAGQESQFVQISANQNGPSSLAVDADGAAGGTNFVTIAVLDGVGASDQIRILLDSQQAAVTVTA